MYRDLFASQGKSAGSPGMTFSGWRIMVLRQGMVIYVEAVLLLLVVSLSGLKLFGHGRAVVVGWG